MRRHAITLPLVLLLLAGCAPGAPTATAPTSTNPATTVQPPGFTTAAAPPANHPSPPSAPTAPLALSATCPETAGWTTNPQSSAASSTAALYLVQASQQHCYDRVVFSVNGPADAGFSVRYVQEVTTDPKGDPLPVPGGAVLQVAVRAPELGYDDAGHQPGRVLAATGDYLVPAAQVAGWPALRAVRFAGFFEGQCSFAVGVRTTLPFRVSTMLDSRNQIREVVVDVAVQ